MDKNCCGIARFPCDSTAFFKFLVLVYNYRSSQASALFDFGYITSLFSTIQEECCHTAVLTFYTTTTSEFDLRYDRRGRYSVPCSVGPRNTWTGVDGVLSSERADSPLCRCAVWLTSGWLAGCACLRVAGWLTR